MYIPLWARFSHWHSMNWMNGIARRRKISKHFWAPKRNFCAFEIAESGKWKKYRALCWYRWACVTMLPLLFRITHNNPKRSHLKTLNCKRIAKQVYGFDNGKERHAHTHTHTHAGVKAGEGGKINCILFVTVRFQVLPFFGLWAWNCVCERETEKECARKKEANTFTGYANTEENCLHSF